MLLVTILQITVLNACRGCIGLSTCVWLVVLWVIQLIITVLGAWHVLRVALAVLILVVRNVRRVTICMRGNVTSTVLLLLLVVLLTVSVMHVLRIVSLVLISRTVLFARMVLICSTVVVGLTVPTRPILPRSTTILFVCLVLLHAIHVPMPLLALLV